MTLIFLLLLLSNTLLPIFYSPQEFFAQDYAFLNKHFYKIDPSHYESHLENPLNLTTEFMEECLQELYNRRTDIIGNPTDKPVDAIIVASLCTAGIQTRFAALKKSLQEYGWHFKTIHIFVTDEQHAQHCRDIFAQLFPQDHEQLPIQWIFTHRRSEIYVRGLGIVKWVDQIAPYYVIIEQSEHFAKKYVMESAKALAGRSICLGAQFFPVKEWRKEAIMHGYDILYPDYNDMVCAWFHSGMNFYVRALHYDRVYNDDIGYKERYVSTHIRRKQMQHDLEESYYFKKLGILHQRKSLVADNQTSYFFGLLRALGTLLYAKEVYASESKYQYHIDAQITVLREAIQRDFSRDGLDRLLSHTYLVDEYKKQLDALCRDSSDKWGNVSESDIYDAYQDVTLLRELLFKKIIKDSLKIVGEAPCRFAIIVYGSMARGEATPYSDIEFGLLLEKNDKEITDYFQKLAAIVIYMLIDLGKTPVSYLSIVSLNTNFSTKKRELFIDYVIPSGFSADGLNHRLPIAEKEYVSHCGTLIEMTDAMLDSKKYNFLTTEAFLYGEQSLFTHYQQEKFKHSLVQKTKASEFLNAEVPLFPQNMTQESGQIDIKTTFYRPFTANLESFDVYFGLHCTSSRERIAALHAQGYISDDDAKFFEQFLEKILWLRFVMQMHNNQRYGDYDATLQPQVDELLKLKDKIGAIFRRVFETFQYVITTGSL